MLMAPYAPAENPPITRFCRLRIVEKRWSTFLTTSSTELA